MINDEKITDDLLNSISMELFVLFATRSAVTFGSYEALLLNFASSILHDNEDENDFLVTSTSTINANGSEAFHAHIIPHSHVNGTSGALFVFTPLLMAWRQGSSVAGFSPLLLFSATATRNVTAYVAVDRALRLHRFQYDDDLRGLFEIYSMAIV